MKRNKETVNEIPHKNVVVITGGTSGIGFLTAKKFLREGDTVILASIDNEQVVQTALNQLKTVAFGQGSVYYRYLDITDQKSCDEYLQGIAGQYGRIDVLVNAAGVRGKVSVPTCTDFADMQRTMQINFMGAVYMATAAARIMVSQKSGTIINISSISGRMVTADDYGYHCSKSALDMATMLLAKEVSPYGVRCLALAPGGVKTGMNTSEWEKEGRKLHIRDKLLDGSEIANAIWLMARPESSCINGSVVMADDGYTAFKGIY